MCVQEQQSSRPHGSFDTDQLTYLSRTFTLAFEYEAAHTFSKA